MTVVDSAGRFLYFLEPSGERETTWKQSAAAETGEESVYDLTVATERPSLTRRRSKCVERCACGEDEW